MTVEQYLDSKDIRYGVNGDEFNVYECPFCRSDEGSFYINKSTWQFICHRGKCGVKGGKTKFMTHFGDTNIETDHSSKPSSNKIEAIPDVEAQHLSLLDNDNDQVLNWLNDERSISLDTVKRMKMGLAKRRFKMSGEVKQLYTLTFPYFHKGKCVGVKYRTLPQNLDPEAPAKKGMSFTAGRDVGIYNHDAIEQDMEYLIVTEGETDTLTLLEAGYDNVVGISGCKGKKADWADDLLKPKKIYLIYDTDEAGQEGAYDFAMRFGADKICNVVLPKFETVEGELGKDLNEWFLAGGTKEQLDRLLEEAKLFPVDGATSAEEAIDELVSKLDAGQSLDMHYKFPWSSINARAGGYNKGHLILIVASPGVGKSTLALNIADYHVEEYGENVLYECPEMGSEDLTKKLVSYKTHTPNNPGENNITREVLYQAKEILSRRKAKIIWGYPQGIETIEAEIARLRSLVKRFDIGMIVYDNLHKLISDTLQTNNMAQRVAYMNRASSMFSSLAKELKKPIFLICQPKKLQDGQVVSIDSIDGADGPKRDCDFGLALHRNKEANLKADDLESFGYDFETPQNFSPKMFVRVEKPRYGPGGVSVLYMDGAYSEVREYRKEDESAIQNPHSMEAASI